MFDDKEKYICSNCQKSFTGEELKDDDNDDGICKWCHHPLVKASEFNEYNPEYEQLKGRVKTYGCQYCWDEIEYIVNCADRLRQRTLFFQALKDLKLTWIKWEE